MTRDPGFEAALMRSYNRYVGRQCRSFPKRLKWAGLLPLRDVRQGLEELEAIEEMAKLGATGAVVYGTTGERLLCDRSFVPVCGSGVGVKPCQAIEKRLECFDGLR